MAVGPGFFCVGYTIGTGSVTSMIVAGSEHGMTLLWVVALSALFSGVLMEAYGRFALATGRTAISAFRTELGNGFALLTLLMVVAGQWCCLSGLVGLSSNALLESIKLLVPSVALTSPQARLVTIGLAIAMLGSLYVLFWFGNYDRFEKFLAALVTILGLSFLVSLFIVAPTFSQTAAGMIPSIPKVSGAAMLVAAMVGTTLAAPTFVVRPLLVLSKGWGKNDFARQRRDSIFSAFLMFVISGSIMACSTAVIYNHGGEPIKNVLDMVETLRPIGGKGAAVLFLTGLISAGLSSILPIAMIAGFLYGDWRGGGRNIRTGTFRILTAIACLLGLTVPILGTNPVVAQVATQVSQVFVLPLVIGGIAVLINRPSLMGKHRAGPLLNFGLLMAMGFALLISWKGVVGLVEFFAKP